MGWVSCGKGRESPGLSRLDETFAGKVGQLPVMYEEERFNGGIFNILSAGGCQLAGSRFIKTMRLAPSK